MHIVAKFLDEIGHQTVVPLMYLGFGIGDFLRHGHWVVIVFAALAGLFSLRFDLLSKAEVVLDFAQSNLGSKFDFYKEFKQGPSPNSVDNKPRPIRLLYHLFAYPAIMNILAVLWLLDRFAGTGNIVYGNAGLIYLLIVANGILIPLRRAVTIRSVAINAQVETDFLEFKSKIK